MLIGLFASLLAYDLQSFGGSALLYWLIGFLAPFLGCLWVRQKHRSEGRGIGRSAWITLTMGAIAGSCVCPIFGTVLGASLTALFILPPTLWIAFISLRGFHRSRDGSFARTIWWRRRWHATLAMCTGAIAVRMWLQPITIYTLGLCLATVVIAGLCLWSLASMSRELDSLTAGVRLLPNAEAEPMVDLGIGAAVWGVVAQSGTGAYRLSETASPRARGDVTGVRAMMRHTLWGALALFGLAASTLATAGFRLLHAR